MTALQTQALAHDANPAGARVIPLDPWHGRVLDGRYRIERRLATGGFGAVYRGTQLAFGRPVAIKLLHGRLVGDPIHAARLRVEARALARVQHPGVVQVVDFGQLAEEGTVYLVMELLRGETLAARLGATGPFAPEAVVDVGLQALEALAEAHACGVIHRDLKPENIFLAQVSGREVVKLLDFGIAKLVGDQAAAGVRTHSGVVLGSPRYLSPEEARDQEITEQTDLYSLGAVLYELLVGRPPFVRRSPLEYLAAHIGEPPDAPVRGGVLLQGRLVQTLLRLLAKHPEERPRGARHAAALLESCRGEPLVEVRTAARSERTPGRARVDTEEPSS